MEWSGRLFVLEMIEPGEEGVGTMVEVKHRSPAKVGEILVFHAELMSVDHKGNVICNVRVETSQGRVVAEGSTGQRILTREVINEKFAT
jgi:predicted thioesterase